MKLELETRFRNQLNVRVLVEGESGDFSSGGPRFLVRIKKNLRSYPLLESLLSITRERTGCKEWDTTERPKNEQKDTSRKRCAMPREANGPGGLGYRVFKARSFS